MDFRLSQQCPFYHPETPQWTWCGRPCTCRAFIINPEARDTAINGGIARAPNYPFNIMPGDTQPGFQPFPGYGDFTGKSKSSRNKPQDPVQRAKAEEVAKSLPNTGFGKVTYNPKPKPRPDDDSVEDATIIEEPLITPPPPKSNDQPDTPAEETSNTPEDHPVRQPDNPDVRQPFDKTAYQRELMRKRRAAQKNKNDPEP